MNHQIHTAHAGLQGSPWSKVAVWLILTAVAFNMAASPGLAQSEQREFVVVDKLEIGKGFSGTNLAPSLLTHGEHQYVAYFNGDQQVTIAHRKLGSRTWEQRELPLYAKWNNHRGRPALAIDANGLLHVSGNMHAEPLNYWRSTAPYNIHTLERIDHMVGEEESRVTYPRFRELPDGRLTFWYRHGGSGRGEQFINVWNPGEGNWGRLLDTPLFDGEGKVGIYPSGPHRDQEGNFHYAFMWRATSNPETNHLLSHVWSEDLETWRTAAGDVVNLPITRQTPGVIVDPVEQGKGLINMHFGVGFDADNRPIVHYHKYDEDGNSQIYNARWEDDGWQIYQTSDWDKRWVFPGAGAIPSRVNAQAVMPTDEVYLSQPYAHWTEGSGVWKLDPETLKPVGKLPRRDYQKPRELRNPHSDFRHEDGSRMVVHWTEDQGDSGEPGVAYYVRRESLGGNRDLPREGELPEARTLMVYKLKEPDQK